MNVVENVMFAGKISMQRESTEKNALGWSIQ